MLSFFLFASLHHFCLTAITLQIKIAINEKEVTNVFIHGALRPYLGFKTILILDTSYQKKAPEK